MQSGAHAVRLPSAPPGHPHPPAIRIRRPSSASLPVGKTSLPGTQAIMRIFVSFGSGMMFLAVSGVSDLHEEMGLSGYQTRVAFDACFDAAVRGQIESAKVRDFINASSQVDSTVRRLRTPQQPLTISVNFLKAHFFSFFIAGTSTSVYELTVLTVVPLKQCTM